MKKTLALLLAVILLLTPVLASCKGDKNENTTPTENTPQATTPEETTPEQTTPGEEIVVPDPTKELTSVSITFGNTPTEELAAKELQKHLEIKGVTVGEGGFPITLSIDSSLGDDAYRIEGAANVTDEQNGDEYLKIIGGNGRGVIYGVVRFLEDYAGTRFFTYELETHTPDPVTLPETVLIDYQPAFEYRSTSWQAMTYSPLFAVKSGMNGFIGGITEEMGGIITYAPGLFVHTFGVLTETDYPYPGYAPNPCLTNPENLEKVIKNVRKALAENPNVNILSISQNDTEKHCECENCLAVDAEEGSPAGTLLRFVNAVADDIKDDYPNVIIDTLAYKYTRKAPTKTVPRDNVCIRLCSIECHFNHPLTTENCSICSAFRYDLQAWGEICDNIYIWDYTTNFKYYISFFPNLHVLRENMQLFADNNVKGMFEQGNGQGPSGEFGELRAYLLAKLMMNPYMTEEEYNTHMDEFLAAYYGAGWKNIRAYIDQYSKLAILGDGHTIYHQPFTSVNENLFRAMEYSTNKWWKAARAEAGDRLEYVERSYLHVRFMQLMLHPNAEKAKQLIADVEGRGMAWREGYWHVNIAETNLSRGPGMWVYE